MVASMLPGWVRAVGIFLRERHPSTGLAVRGEAGATPRITPS